jgi:hypothetical protein
MKLKYLIVPSILAFTSLSLAITPQIGDVSDQRTTGQFFAELGVEIKLLGDDAADVKSLHVDVSKAVDDTGRNLINPERIERGYQELNQYSGSKIKLVLKNPARKATTFNLSGNLTAVVPSKDPASKVLIKNVFSTPGNAFKNPTLAAAKISFSVMTKADVDKAAEEEKKKAEKANKQQGAGGVAQMLEAAFGGGNFLGENDLQYKVVDPENKLVSFRLLKSDGEEFKHSSYMSSGETRTYSYYEAVPKDITLEIIIATEKSLQKVPFNFSNVFLP